MQGYRGGEESEIIIRLIMGAQVHHRCKSTGETFTEAGWKKWLKSHDPSKAVTEYKEFGYDINDVCLTPRKTVEWHNRYCAITITTSRKYYGFLYAMTFPILKQDQVQADNPIGSGPYYIQAFSPGDYIYLSAYSNWWKSTPAITQINVVLFASNKELINAYEYNRIDAAVTRSSNAAQYSRSASSVSARAVFSFIAEDPVWEEWASSTMTA